MSAKTPSDPCCDFVLSKPILLAFRKSFDGSSYRKRGQRVRSGSS